MTGLLLLLSLPAYAANTAKTKAPSYDLAAYAPSTAPVTAALILERFEAFDRGLETLTADFRQLVRWEEGGGAPQGTEGSLEFMAPNRLRIEHRLPEPQTLVADGRWLWIWRKSTNQVIRTSLEDWKQSEPLAQGLLDFGRYAELLRRYDVAVATVSAPGADGHREAQVRLKPKQPPEKGDFVLILKLSTKDFFPRQTEMSIGEVTITCRFSNVKRNAPLKAERFHFAPPPGADVFNNFKPPRRQP